MILRFVLRLALSALFLLAGTLHLIDPRLFLPVMPPLIPGPLLCILVSGLCELLGGVGLLIANRKIQVMTGWGLILLMLAIFPANIYMAVKHIKIDGMPTQPWMGWVRLPLQPLLMLAVAWVTDLNPSSPSPAQRT